jgi:hypothetical protein
MQQQVLRCPEWRVTLDQSEQYYFRVNESGAQLAEDTTDVLGWIVGHERVRDIFDKMQIKKNGSARMYLIANMTRWTTHSISFHRLIRLKAPLREAAIT